MSDIANKLRLIMEGSLLLEAPEDKYDLPTGTTTEDDDKPEKDKKTPDNKDADTATPDTEGGDDKNADVNKDLDPTNNTTDTDDDAGGNYDLDDDSNDDSDNDSSTPVTSDDSTSTGSDDSTVTTPEPKVGEVLNIDPKTRAIFAFKNFERYRDLRDDTNRLITELSEFVPVSDDVRLIVNTTIEKGTDLVTKLTDYILYKYNDNSYEINYYNYMQFLLEKRYLNELYAAIIKSSSQVKKNK